MPKSHSPEGRFSYTTFFETLARFINYNINGGTAIIGTAGVELTRGSTAGSSTSVHLNNSADPPPIFNSAFVFCTAVQAQTTGAGYDAYVCLGYPADATDDYTDGPDAYFGFYFESDGAAVTVKGIASGLNGSKLLTKTLTLPAGTNLTNNPVHLIAVASPESVDFFAGSTWLGEIANPALPNADSPMYPVLTAAVKGKAPNTGDGRVTINYMGVSYDF